MFCHNCGTDCGEFKFCPNCGTQLLSGAAKETQKTEASKAAWTEGTPCPYCGGLQIVDGKCTFCGVQLAADQSRPVEKEECLLDIPCGVYNGVTSSLTLYETECVVRATILFFKKYETRIPYDKIKSVVYVRSLYKASSIGYLLFRWEGNENVPIPADNNYSADKTTITTSTGKDTLFYHIYHMLKAVAPASAEFRTIIPNTEMPGLEELAAKTNLERYFDEFAPLRQKAVEELRKKTGASQEAATVLIDRVFDARQKERYERDPKAAIHDLNLFLDNKRKLEEQAAKEKRERMEKAKRDALLYELEKQNR